MMPKDHNFYNSLLQCIYKNNNSSTLPNFDISIQHAEKSDLYQILELLLISHETQTQVKLFSILAAYLVSNGPHSDVIIKFNPLYDKICAILTRGLPHKTNVTLNLVTALLYTENVDASSRRRSLVVYAQNMIRVSGCLTAMCNLFTGCMLHQETWQALSRSLAEVCCGLEVNQKYCSHLIPLCVRRCQPGNEHLFQLVHSLLSNNERNTRLFYESGGNYMFKREFLKYERCLELLNTVLSKSVIKTEVLRETNILHDLENLKRLYGPSSQVGQWVTIILYSIDLNGPEITKEIREDNKQAPNVHSSRRKDLCFDHSDDTSVLFKNVIKEVLHFKPRKCITNRTLNLYEPNKINSNLNQYSNEKNVSAKINNTIYKHVQDRSDNLSFSFLLSKSSDKPLTNYQINSENFGHKNTFDYTLDSRLQTSHKRNNYARYSIDMTLNNDKDDIKDIVDFRPTFVSTPKSVCLRRRNRASISRIDKRHSSINKKNKNRLTNSFTDFKVKLDPKKIDQSQQHRTIGARLFDVINESCTTIMKSVKNVFRPKKKEESFVNASVNYVEEHRPHCSNSFTNYMRHRQSFLNEQNNDSTSHWNEPKNECNTCNDTLSLKRKFENDEFLKETVKKLKLGINLYGCDFKKLSKTLWRYENYMTPTVLYNLYRKLIAK